MTKQTSVSAIVSQGRRMAASRAARNTPTIRLGFAGVAVSGVFSNQTPSNGANSTATNQETISATVTTANMEKVYSPAALLAKPIGTKPAAVTSDPVSMGNAREL